MKSGISSHHREYSFFYPSNGGDDIEMACRPPTDNTLDLHYRNEYHSGPSLLPAPVIAPTAKTSGKMHNTYRSPPSSFSPASRSATMDTLVSPTTTASTRLPSPATSSSSTLYTTSSITIQQKRDLIITLGQALLNYGSPSYRVENGLKLTASKLDLKIIFTFTPETLMMTAVPAPATPLVLPSTQVTTKPAHHHHHQYQEPYQQSLYNRRKDRSRYRSITALISKKLSHHKRQKKKKRKKRKSYPNVTPTTPEKADHQPWVILIKTGFSPDNCKLGKITRLMHHFYNHTVPFDKCLSDLNAIIDAPATCGPWTLIASFVCIAFSASIIMFKGTWIDSGFAAFFGLVAGSLLVLASNHPVYAHVYEVSACAAVSVIVRCLHNYCCFNATVIPSIIVLLPGYSMTMAVMEITAKHIVTGSIRLIHVIFYSFLLAYGMALGSYLYDAFHPDAPSDGYCPDDDALLPPEWVNIPLFPIMAAGISMTFGSAPHQWISEILCAALGYCVTFFLGPLISDTSILNAISAFVVGLYAHLALKVTGEPPISPISVGLTLLVPGSIGVRGAYALLHQKDLVKLDFALQMLNIAIGLSVGLFASGMVVYPSGKPRSLYISM